MNKKINVKNPTLDMMLGELKIAIKQDPKLEYMIKYQNLYKQKYNTN